MKISLKDWSLKQALIYFILYIIFRSFIQFGTSEMTFNEYINSKYIFEAIGIGVLCGMIMGFVPSFNKAETQSTKEDFDGEL